MKVDTNELGGLRLQEVYNPIELVTNADEHLSVCMRDSGFEVWYKLRRYDFKEGKRDPVLSGMRRSGNTTRQIDAAVQTLFDKGAVTWMDHAAEPGNMAQEHGFNILLDRLYHEHDIRVINGNLEVNKTKWQIALK